MKSVPREKHNEVKIKSFKRGIKSIQLNIIIVLTILPIGAQFFPLFFVVAYAAIYCCILFAMVVRVKKDMKN